MGSNPGRHPGRATARQLLEQHRLIDLAGGGAAILLAVFKPKQVEGAEPLEEIPRKLPLCLPVVDVRPDFFLDELADCRPKLFMLAAEEMRPRRGYVCQ